MRFVIVNRDEDRAILSQQFFQQLRSRIHHAEPFIMACGVFAFLADGLADPFFELRLVEFVVVDPAFVAGVLRRVNINALDASSMRGQQSF
jgi:hypothetical protein